MTVDSIDILELLKIYTIEIDFNILIDKINKIYAIKNKGKEMLH